MNHSTHGRQSPVRPASSAAAQYRSNASWISSRLKGMAGYSRSMIVTLAWPPPSHIVCRP